MNIDVGLIEDYGDLLKIRMISFSIYLPMAEPKSM